MAIFYAFLLALLASSSLQAAWTVDHSSTLSLRHEAQSNNVTSKRADARNVTIRYHDSNNRFGHDSYCGPPRNQAQIQNHTYRVNDCVALINTLAGNAADGYYSGWWEVKDWDYCRAGNDSWMMIAGWETCNIAVVTPDCSDSPTPISRLDIAKAIAWLLPDCGQTDGIASTGTMQCMVADNPVNVSFQMFDPSDLAVEGAGSTRLHGLVGVNTTSSSITTSTTASSTLTTSTACDFSKMLSCNFSTQSG